MHWIFSWWTKLRAFIINFNSPVSSVFEILMGCVNFEICIVFWIPFELKLSLMHWIFQLVNKVERFLVLVWMGIERTLADRKGRDFCELPKETITSSRSRRNRRRQKKMPPVQRLFDTCKEVFASSGTGIVPPAEDIDKLRSVLGTRFLFFFFSS